MGFNSGFKGLNEVQFSFHKIFTTCKVFDIAYHSQPEATLHKQAYYDLTFV